MHNSQKNRNVTMINDLPDLEDLEQNSQMYQQNDHPGMYPEKFQKFIRNPHNSPPESGMYPQKEFYQTGPPINPPNSPNPSNPSQYNNHAHETNCLDFNSHVMGCPICSRFYNNDNTIYIIAIVVLSIVCVLLLKKVLNL